MLERPMSETPSSSGAARAEVARTPEIRETPDHRTKVVGALNRTLDRAQKERDEVMGRVLSSGSGAVTPEEVEIVLGYQYASEAVKKLAGGRDRLDYDVERDTFKVPVRDRETGQEYERGEGIPIGYLERFLDREARRLRGERFDARFAYKDEEANALDREASEVFADLLTLQGSSRATKWSFYRDYYDEGVPHDLLYNHPSSPGSILPLEVLQSNREETEAWLRSQNPEIARLGGENPEQNMAEAMRDIGYVRRELELPEKGVPDPMDKYKVPVVSPPESIEASEVIEESPSEAAEIVTDVGRVKERDDSGRDILGTALDKIGSGRERVRRFVGGLSKPGLRRALLIVGNLVGGAGLVAGVGMLVDQQLKASPAREYDYGNAGAKVGTVNPTQRQEPVWESSSVPQGLVSSEVGFKSPVETVGSSGPHRQVEVDIPGKGKETLNIRILNGTEPEIFNVKAAERQGMPIPISGSEVRRAIENPDADDETSRLIRSYLDEDTTRLVNSLPEARYLFLTKGPQGEKIKEGFGSFLGLNDARVMEAEMQKRFDMRSPEDLSKLEGLRKTPEYKQAQRVIIADRLLRSVPGYGGGQNADHPGVVGFLSNGTEITDIIVTAPSNDPYVTRDVSSIIRNRGKP